MLCILDTFGFLRFIDTSPSEAYSIFCSNIVQKWLMHLLNYNRCKYRRAYIIDENLERLVSFNNWFWNFDDRSIDLKIMNWWINLNFDIYSYPNVAINNRAKFLISETSFALSSMNIENSDVLTGLTTVFEHTTKYEIQMQNPCYMPKVRFIIIMKYKI